MRFDIAALDPDVRRRWAALKELLGDEEAAMKASLTEEELVRIISAGLGITKEEAVEIIRILLGVGGQEATSEETMVATKSQRGRDSMGRRIDKPNQPASRTAEEPQGPRRDSRGRRIHKPNDPRRAWR